jgi:hypothetical protein
METQKKTTDSTRALLGEKELRMWEDRAGVAMIASMDDLVDRTAYLYANPAKAGLVDKIDDFPGFSTWQEFISCPAHIDATIIRTVRWHRVENLPVLPAHRQLSIEKAEELTAELLGAGQGLEYQIKIKPFSICKGYGIADPVDLEEYRQRVIAEVRAREERYRNERRKAGQSIIGSERLQQQQFMAKHTPKARTRKIFLLCMQKEHRIALLELFDKICEQCRECLEQAKRGATANWPPGILHPTRTPAVWYDLNG